MFGRIPERSTQTPVTASESRCAWCGDEIYDGEPVFSGDEGVIHRGCLLPLIQEQLDVSLVAERLGYEETIFAWDGG